MLNLRMDIGKSIVPSDKTSNLIFVLIQGCRQEVNIADFPLVTSSTISSNSKGKVSTFTGSMSSSHTLGIFSLNSKK